MFTLVVDNYTRDKPSFYVGSYWSYTILIDVWKDSLLRAAKKLKHMNTDSLRRLEIGSDELVIRAELDRVLAERRFSGAPQMSAFLRYIVNQTLVGHGDRIKAFSVGVDALGKPDNFDAQSDPSVRVLALRLRRTLATMYEDPEQCKAIIELRVGTYVPAFFQAPTLTTDPSLSEAHANDVTITRLATSIC